MLHLLPPEVVEKIGVLLPQNDLLSLMTTSRYFYRLLHPRLYSVIIFDSSPHLFHYDTKSLNAFQQHRNDYKIEGKFVRGVRIRSVFALKAFMKCVVKYAHYIKALMVSNLPDISDLVSFDYFGKILPLMIQLQIFSWNHIVPLPLSYLKYNSQICTMSGLIETDCCAQFPCMTKGVYTEVDIAQDLDTITLRNIDLTDLEYDFSQVQSLTLDNCTYKRDYLFDQDFTSLEHLSLIVEDDPSMVKLLSKLNLRSLLLKTETPTSGVLHKLNSGIMRLELNSKFDLTCLKQLSRFTNLRYLQIPVLEKDILEILPFISQSTQFLHLHVLETTERNNCLIADEYWECTVDQNLLKFQDFVLEYHRRLNNLQWVMFNGNNKKYVFECSESVIYRERFSCYFGDIVNTLL
ncbi:hypothetical protein CANMA_002372 [Candida margitis]|uniref:uncharacterized protein n=1 Tax=Candida margitis TaxID=1775924 RepID=UPI002227A602|nr:uncharacterized protein CANMA_002372 [Candida margitis]KAI5968381.1 hypothetical protein CANMA_002372 [Candida margitis]